MKSSEKLLATALILIGLGMSALCIKFWRERDDAREALRVAREENDTLDKVIRQWVDAHPPTDGE